MLYVWHIVMNITAHHKKDFYVTDEPSEKMMIWDEFRAGILRFFLTRAPKKSSIKTGTTLSCKFRDAWLNTFSISGWTRTKNDFANQGFYMFCAWGTGIPHGSRAHTVP